MFIATIASTVIGVASSLMQGQATAAAAEMNADIQRQNAVIAQREAESAAEDKRRERRRVLGSIRASYGGSGIDFAGSGIDVLYDTATEYALDERKILYRGRVKQIAHQNQAELDEAEASNARTMGWLGAGASLMGGLSDYYKTRSEFGQDLG